MPGGSAGFRAGIEPNMEQLNDKLRSRLRQDAVASPCPSSETLVSALTGRLRRSLRDKLIDHLLRCEECTREIRLLAELDARLAPLLAEKMSARSGRREGVRRPRFRPVWAAAALPFLAAALWLFVIRPGPLPEDDVFRGESVAAVEFLAPGDSLSSPAAGAEFRWAPVAGAGLYKLDILDGSLETVFSSGPGTETRLTLPPEVRGALTSGRTYFARVTAFDSSGIAVAAGMLKFVAE